MDLLHVLMDTGGMESSRTPQHNLFLTGTRGGGQGARAGRWPRTRWPWLAAWERERKIRFPVKDSVTTNYD